MGNAGVWWAITGTVVALELVTGTFYLLMIALGLACGAVAGHLGATLTTQMVVTAVVGGAAVALWHLRQAKRPRGLPASANKDVNLDIGETVDVEQWASGDTTTVRYRGAQWAAALASGAVAGPGSHRIVEVQGSRLVLTPV